MRWRKLGLVYAPDGTQTWARSHAMLPTPLVTDSGTIRIYLAQLDERSVGHVSSIDVEVSDPKKVVHVGKKPLLGPGEPGTFDDNGVVPSSVVSVGNELYLYYFGFQLQTKIPYTIFAGLASSKSTGGEFKRRSQSPILDRMDGQRYLRSAPFVMRDGDRWRMWYVCGDEWVRAGEKILPSYAVRHIESDDGIHWPGPGTECLVPQPPDEIGFGRPFVVRDGSHYRMWYSIRGVGDYRIGYATSRDGLEWDRRDGEAGIARSDTGWDSEKICYAAILRTKQQWIMFYNGNGYGRTGVGVAISDGD